eukprot:c27514_g1_i3 orf=190-477(-)
MLIQTLQMAYDGRSAAAEESATKVVAMQEDVCAPHTQRSLSGLTPIYPARAASLLHSPPCCYQFLVVLAHVHVFIHVLSSAVYDGSKFVFWRVAD